jgi:NAD(P)-dependent dehydrogenase (short-subunit alcohol dehydrogenase family)
LDIDTSFAGQVVLVTGASRGIGSATARLFADRGAILAVNYRQDGSGASRTVTAIQENGGCALAIQANVAVPQDCKRLTETVEDQLGPIQVLVNNAAAFQKTPFLDITLDEFDRLLETNLRGVFYLSQLAARQMATRRRGCIIHVSSILARQAIPGRAAYCASKGAIESLTRAMALDLAGYNIRVNAIAPGLIETEALTGSFQDVQEEEAVRQYIPGRRFGRPEEIAQAIVFLASPAAGYINGALIPVDSALSIMEPGPPGMRTS